MALRVQATRDSEQVLKKIGQLMGSFERYEQVLEHLVSELPRSRKELERQSMINTDLSELVSKQEKLLDRLKEDLKKK